MGHFPSLVYFHLVICFSRTDTFHGSVYWVHYDQLASGVLYVISVGTVQSLINQCLQPKRNAERKKRLKIFILKTLQHSWGICEKVLKHFVKNKEMKPWCLRETYSCIYMCLANLISNYMLFKSSCTWGRFHVSFDFVRLLFLVILTAWHCVVLSCSFFQRRVPYSTCFSELPVDV